MYELESRPETATSKLFVSVAMLRCGLLSDDRGKPDSTAKEVGAGFHFMLTRLLT